MRAPLHGQAAVLAALLALSTCLTGKELLLPAVIQTQAGVVKLLRASKTAENLGVPVPSPLMQL